jgi:hypothetical protein
VKTISWKIVLRIIALLSLFLAAAWSYFEFGFEPALAFLGAIATFIVSFFVEGNLGGATQLSSEVTLFDADCGNKAVNLADQRLRVSAAFGAYFAGLLEREENYIPLAGQIECPISKGQEGLPPIQRIFWHLQNPKGPRLFILAAEGGMGKSTLASKLVRCLYDQEAVDMILGDSAKSEHVDPVSGRLLTFAAGYETGSGFYQRLCSQLGVPYENDDLAVTDIHRRLVNRRAVIVVDNLETVAQGDKLLHSLLKITGRDVRAVITTRRAVGLDILNRQHLLVHLNPVQKPGVAADFLHWHIGQHSQTHPDLVNTQSVISNKRNLDWLIERSGGVPLLMQLLLSDIARSSWEQMHQLPALFGPELLNFLYAARWQELQQLGQSGLLACELLLWLKQEQFSNRRITAKQLNEWVQNKSQGSLLSEALTLLHERFLIVNSDRQKGNYAIFPSLAEFLQAKG